ncbi:VHS domain-containing protein [Neofusicoccum parvum]|nr:VHS domain-containing protein [Neofusicoccum parvum]
MAARDRFGGFAEPAMSPLQRYIMNACDPQNFEPNLALNIEIAELVNQKKGSAPREAAMEIVKFVNSRNPNVSLLALNLLDICVKNCGYPFHLQISTKEFLNELVRRFPERPPVHSSRVQNRILELIEEWRSTICMTSRYKEDLGFIRDMHRLLSYKGYTFPEIRREDAAVLNPSDNLRSPEEMEQEEREAQSAKLQELIRRGTPHDLQEANRLMKVMAGFDTRNKTDYRAKAAEEVGKIQQKAKLLEDMLQKHQAGDQIKEGDVFEELANALASAHPKIQKMCEEESDDHEAVAKLLEINDSIHRTLERYKLIKKGDVEGAAKIPKGTLGVSGAGVKKGPDNELSLIDFGGPEEAPAPAGQAGASSSAPVPKGNALEDDLLGLNLGDDTFGQGGGISLGATNGAALQPQPSSQTPVQNLLGIRTDFTVSRQSDNTIHIQSVISNNTPAPISELTMQFAVTKGYTLKLQPQSGRLLQPNQQSGIAQNIDLQGVEPGKGSSVKMRWRASYMLGPERKEEQGEITSLGVS